MERYQATKNMLNNRVTFSNPNNDEVCRIIQGQQKNPYIELQQRIFDVESGKELGTSTLIPYLMIKHNLIDGLIKFVEGFQNLPDETMTELVVQEQLIR